VIGPRGPELLEIRGAVGDLVSLLPLSESVVGVTTDGLTYPLRSATLKQGPTLGLSNELSGERASVSVERGRLAVIHTRRENS
jgi:thiamine pyrophosphokinase